mgnify:CR=1 FL=1
MDRDELRHHDNTDRDEVDRVRRAVVEEAKVTYNSKYYRQKKNKKIFTPWPG